MSAILDPWQYWKIPTETPPAGSGARNLQMAAASLPAAPAASPPPGPAGMAAQPSASASGSQARQWTQAAGALPAPTAAAPPNLGGAGQNLYQVGALNTALPEQAISDQTAGLMKSKVQDQVLKGAAAARQQLAARYAAMGMGQSGVYGTRAVDVERGVGRDVASAGRDVDIQQAQTNAEYGLNRAASTRADYSAQTAALAQRAGLSVEQETAQGQLALGQRGQDVTARGQDLGYLTSQGEQAVTVRGQDINQQLGLGQQDVARRGQDIDQQLGQGNQDVTRRGQDIQQQVTTRGQDIDQQLGQGNQDVTRRGQDIQQQVTTRGQDIDQQLGLGNQNVQLTLGNLSNQTAQRGQTLGYMEAAGSQALQAKQIDQQNQQFLANLQQQGQQFAATYGLNVYQAQQDSEKWHLSLDLQKQQLDQTYQVQMQDLQLRASTAQSQEDLQWAQTQIAQLDSQYSNQLKQIQSLGQGVEMLTRLGVPPSALLGEMQGQAPTSDIDQGLNDQQLQDLYRSVVPGYGATKAGTPIDTSAYNPPNQQYMVPLLNQLLGRAA